MVHGSFTAVVRRQRHSFVMGKHGIKARTLEAWNFLVPDPWNSQVIGSQHFEMQLAQAWMLCLQLRSISFRCGALELD